MIKEAARERMMAGKKINPTEFIPEGIPESQTSSQQIAKLFNTNEKYVRDAEIEPSLN